MRTSCKRPRDEPSDVAPPSPSSTGDTMAEEFVDLVAANVPPSFTLDDSDIRCMLETIMTIQAAHGQLLVDMLD